jgi:hypothetical protein
MPLIAQQPLPLIVDDWGLFTTELFKMFGNKHLRDTAEQILSSMKMSEDIRLTEHLVKFNSYTVYTGWNDAAIAGAFYRSLASRLKDMFQFVDKPGNFDDLRDLALTFDHRFWQKEEEHGRFPVSATKSADKGKATASNPKSSTSTQRNTAQSSTAAPSSASSSAQSTAPSASTHRTNQTRTTNTKSNDSTKTTAPSNSANQPSKPSSKPRGPLSQEEKDRRRAENLCLYCGKPDHGWRECVHLPANRQKATGRAVYTFTASEQHTGCSHDQEKLPPTQGEEESS